MILARLDRLVYGAGDPKAGAVDSVFKLLEEPRLNHRIRVTAGVRREECGAILTQFFRKKRGQGGGEV
jgi:tRNA(adenine34) deaminase